MNKIIISVAILLLLAVAAHAAPNAAMAFNSFKAKYNKQYDDPQEEARRFQIFQENMVLADKLNSEHQTNVFGIATPFADMSKDEFAATYLMDTELVMNEIKDQEPNVTFYQPSGLTFPPSGPLPTFDWSSRGVCTPIKNQGGCGSCWAFAATTVLESRWAIAGRGLKVLAPQQYVDCTYTYDGCNGGFYTSAWQYAYNAGGQTLNTNYPYTASYGGCRFNKASMGVAARPAASSYSYVAGEGALFNYVQSTAPVAVAVDASYWYLYQSGVFPASSCTGGINHAVVANGYANVNGVNVWRIRNSWGNWGQSGYIYLPMGSNACSVGNYAYAVNV